MQTTFNPQQPGGMARNFTSAAQLAEPYEGLVPSVVATIHRLQDQAAERGGDYLPAGLSATDTATTLLKCADNSCLDFGALPLADQRVTRSVEDQGLDRHAAPVSLVLSSLPADAWRQLEKAAGGEVTTVVLPGSMVGDPKRALEMQGLKALQSLRTVSLAADPGEKEIDLRGLPPNCKEVVLRISGDGPVIFRAQAGVNVSVVDEQGHKVDESRLSRLPADNHRPDEMRPATVAFFSADAFLSIRSSQISQDPEPPRASPLPQPPVPAPVPVAKKQGFFYSLKASLSRWMSRLATPAAPHHHDAPVWRAVKDMQSRFPKHNPKLQAIAPMAKKGFADDSLRMLLAADRFVRESGTPAQMKSEFVRMMGVLFNDKEEANISTELRDQLNQVKNSTPFNINTAKELTTLAGIEFYGMLADNVKTTSGQKMTLADQSLYGNRAA